MLFVTTTNEKTIIAKKVSPIIDKIKPKNPGLKIFDAGLGDGTLLMNVLRSCHRKFPTIPFLVVGKEISLEDVRLTVEKLSDRFIEHPNMVFVLTNLHYNEATKFKSQNLKKQKKIFWKNIRLSGNSSYQFNQQLNNFDSLLKKNWQVERNPINGNTTYKNPSVLVIYRQDHEMLLHNLIPSINSNINLYDLIIASQPYRSRISEEKKCQYVINPMINSLSRGGKLFIVHSFGNDPGSKLIKKIWPKDNPFPTLGNKIIKYLNSNFDREFLQNLIIHKPKIFKYNLRALPNEIENGISTSLIFSAWNNINYVNQINDDKIKIAEKNSKNFDFLAKLLKRNDGLFFNDEILLIEKK